VRSTEREHSLQFAGGQQSVLFGAHGEQGSDAFWQEELHVAGQDLSSGLVQLAGHGQLAHFGDSGHILLQVELEQSLSVLRGSLGSDGHCMLLLLQPGSQSANRVHWPDSAKSMGKRYRVTIGEVLLLFKYGIVIDIWDTIDPILRLSIILRSRIKE
jgi:hypothetical protein